MTVAVVVLVFNVAWAGIYLASGNGIRSFAVIGRGFENQSNASAVIHHARGSSYTAAPNLHHADDGYDGQFNYFIALDPARARYYIDEPAYRYERILYPMLARFSALEQPAAVPWTLLIINVLAPSLGVLALAGWLRRRGASPWLALFYGLNPGMVISVQTDLAEPLAFGLVATAIYLFDYGGRRRVWLAGLAFGLAALARETTLLFAVPFGLSILTGRIDGGLIRTRRARAQDAAVFFALAVIPFAAWVSIDYAWLGPSGSGPGNFSPIPFSGLAGSLVSPGVQEMLVVGVPALIFSAIALRALKRPDGRLERACMLLVTALLVVFTDSNVWVDYHSLERQAIPLVLAALLCMPYQDTGPAAQRGPRLMANAIALSFLLWTLPLPLTLASGAPAPERVLTSSSARTAREGRSLVRIASQPPTRNRYAHRAPS